MKSQIEKAVKLGEAAFKRGKVRAPACCREVLEMLKGRTIGVTPNGEAPTVVILTSWLSGWDKAATAACTAHKPK